MHTTRSPSAWQEENSEQRPEPMNHGYLEEGRRVREHLEEKACQLL